MSPDAAERWLESAPEPEPAAPVEPESAAPPVAEEAPPPATPPTTTTTAPPEPPAPDVRGMSPDAAERWLESAAEPEPAAPVESAQPAPDVRGMSPDAAERWLESVPEAAEPPAPANDEPPPDVRGMSPDAAERWLESDEEEPLDPLIYGVDRDTYNSMPEEDQSQIREDWEREQPLDPGPGCAPVQGPYLNEADRPCAFPDGTQIPTGQIGSQPEEAHPCIPLQGPYLNEADRPCAFPDGREIPAGLVAPPPEPGSEPAPEPAAGVGSGGGGGGGGSWGGEEEEDRPAWQDVLSWTGEQTVWLGTGFVEGVQGIGEGGLMLYRLSPTNMIVDNESWRDEWSNMGEAAQFAWENPDEFGQAVINWEDIEEGRYGEWLGNLGPDAVVAVATAGTGRAATATTRAVRSVDSVADVADAARDADRAADAADAARDADRAADAADSAPTAPVAPDMPPRPSWRQSELDVGGELGPGYEEQLSFLGGRQVPSGTQSSVRPDWFGNGEAVEVKNYNVQTTTGRSRLVRVLGAQLQARADNLPEGTTQRVFIDIRGQELSPAERTALAQQIADNSAGAIEPGDVTFMRR
jgi:hypothetical protein